MKYDNSHNFMAVPGFPQYGVSRFGRFFNNENDREMTLSPNQFGELTVGLVRNGVQYRRSAKVLVAKAWVPGENAIFNTPIQLDGNRFNLHADNLVWRPRWFAWKYQRQLTEPTRYSEWGPVMELTTGVVYSTIREAALTTGCLISEIAGAIHAQTYVFPDRLKFVYIEKG